MLYSQSITICFETYEIRFSKKGSCAIGLLFVILLIQPIKSLLVNYNK